MKVLFLDCFSGISGDMSLAALVDAGANREYIEEELRKIQMEPFTLDWRRVNKRGISALKMDVVLDPEKKPTQHRHYSEIVDMIVRAGFSAQATSLSLAIFEKIGIAEAKIHDIPLDRVHFHEVGAIDSIVDVIGVALAIDSLGIDRIICTPVPLGSGTVHCDHGIYPVPAPATLEMMRGLPIAPTHYAMEMTTPTGAGIVSGMVDEFSTGLPPIIVESIGYGAGTRDLPNQPNVLRVIIGRSDGARLSQWKVQHDLRPLEEPVPHHHHQHNIDDAVFTSTSSVPDQTGIVGHGHSHSHEDGHHHQHSHSHGDDHDHEHSPGNDHDHVEHVHDHDHTHTHKHGHEHEQTPLNRQLINKQGMPQQIKLTHTLFQPKHKH